MGARWPLGAAILAATALLAGGCGGDDDSDSGSGSESQQALTAQPATGDGPQGISYDEYQSGVEEIVELLDEYWDETLPEEFDVDYAGPSDIVPYDSSGNDLPKCGGEPAPPGNAYYCGANDTVAWDETGLMIPF